MTRIFTREVRHCGECPNCEFFDASGVYFVWRCKAKGAALIHQSKSRNGKPKTIPSWCPLPLKEKETK